MASNPTQTTRTVANLATEIRVEMLRQGQTVAALADHLCVTPQAVGRKLNGHRGLSLTDLLEIAAWLGVSAADLMSRAEAVATAKRPAKRAAA